MGALDGAIPVQAVRHVRERSLFLRRVPVATPAICLALPAPFPLVVNRMPVIGREALPADSVWKIIGACIDMKEK